jgi:hypothetical protein
MVDAKTSDFGLTLLRLFPSLFTYITSKSYPLLDKLMNFDGSKEEKIDILKLLPAVSGIPPSICSAMLDFFSSLSSQPSSSESLVNSYIHSRFSDLESLKAMISIECNSKTFVPLTVLVQNIPLSVKTKNFFRVNIWTKLIAEDSVQNYLGISVEYIENHMWIKKSTTRISTEY